MQNYPQEQLATPRSQNAASVGKIVAIILACFAAFVLLVTLALNSAYDSMRPHDQKLVHALKDDFFTGHWNLEKTRQTAQQNLQESKAKLKEANKQVEEAERAYQQSLAEQKRIVAAAKKKKAAKAFQASKPIAEEVAGPTQVAGRE